MFPSSHHAAKALLEAREGHKATLYKMLVEPVQEEPGVAFHAPGSGGRGQRLSEFDDGLIYRVAQAWVHEHAPPQLY